MDTPFKNLMTMNRSRLKTLSSGYLLFLLIPVMASLTLTSHALAVDETSIEGKLKAAYLFNFLRFAEWPESSNKSINICVIGNKKTYRNALLALTTKSINNRPISVNIYDDESNLKIDKCQLVFITDLRKNTEDTFIKNIETLPILTVGENRNFINHGGMVNFVPAKDKIRFEINMVAVKETDIRISSKILRLAERVID